MANVLNDLVAYVREHGGRVLYSEFVEQVPVSNRAQMVEQARRVLHFRLVAEDGEVKHYVTLKDGD